jgi:hypothetical protein
MQESYLADCKPALRQLVDRDGNGPNVAAPRGGVRFHGEGKVAGEARTKLDALWMPEKTD